MEHSTETALTSRFSIADFLAGPAGADFFRGFGRHPYERGALVCTGVNDENGVFVVVEGLLRVYLVGEDREMTLFYLQAGDIFCTHSGALVEATEPTEVRFCDFATFQKKLEVYPAISLALVAILGRAIMSCMRTIEDLTFRDIKQRVASFFLDRIGNQTRNAGADIAVSIDLTVEDIANLIGASRQATSTALNSLLKAGYLKRQDRSNYTIPDVAALRKVAAGR
jgi:CRP/FNR family transcriptional regulator, carbon monoxide oxidation system transcription regulator